MKLDWRIGLYCLLGGLCFTLPALGTGHFGWWWLCGLILTATFVPAVRYGPRSPLAQFGAIFLALVVAGQVCTLSEAVLFFPEMKPYVLGYLVGGAAMNLVAVAALVVLAKRWPPAAPELAVEHRSWVAAIPMVLLSGLSYVIYYLIFGSIAFQFFSKQYYPRAQEQVAALGLWFWVFELARGVAMTLAVAPIIYTLRLPRWKAALAVGAILWLGGGGAGLLVPSSIMVTAQRYIHIVEIMTQNVSLGITAVLLLRPKTVRLPANAQTAPTPAL
jgi:hypothetical protein